MEEFETQLNFVNASKLAEKAISDTLLDFKIFPNLDGFRFIVASTEFVMRHGQVAITKELYPYVARVCGSTPSKVERCIRNAIKLSFDYKKLTVFNDLFGKKFLTEDDYLSNSEFIFLLAEFIKNTVDFS